MKKIFAIFAATAIALTFNACQSQNDPENSDDQKTSSKDFSLKVTNITKHTAQATITPKDTAKTYWFYYERLGRVPEDQIQIDTLALLADKIIRTNMMYESLSSDKDIPYSHYLYKGETVGEKAFLKDLFPGTKYILFAFYMDTTGTPSGELATVKFMTEKPQVVEQKEIVLNGLYYHNKLDNAIYELNANTEDFSHSIFLAPRVNSITDSLTLDNFDLREFALITSGYTTSPIAEVHLSADTADNVLTLKGSVIAEDGIEYITTITAEQILGL